MQPNHGKMHAQWRIWLNIGYAFILTDSRLINDTAISALIFGLKMWACNHHPGNFSVGENLTL